MYDISWHFQASGTAWGICFEEFKFGGFGSFGFLGTMINLEAWGSKLGFFVEMYSCHFLRIPEISFSFFLVAISEFVYRTVIYRSDFMIRICNEDSEVVIW